MPLSSCQQGLKAERNKPVCIDCIMYYHYYGYTTLRPNINAENILEINIVLDCGVVANVLGCDIV